MEKRTKIVCTMGPANEDDEVLRQLILHGMNVARFNFSHGSHEYHRNNIDRVRRLSEELNTPVAILLDTKGPEIRTGLLEGGQPVELVAGARTTITTDECVGNAERFCLDYANLPSELSVGSTVLIDDGLIGLTVLDIDGNDILCEIQNGGMLGEKKGVNLPDINVGLPAVTEQDRADIMFGCELGIDAVAASFVRDAGAVTEIREICEACGSPDVQIFSKIESAQGVRNFDEILQVSDGIMVARGDLGVEMPEAEVPHIQKEIIRKCNLAYKPVITATQMLDSMTHNPRPTRAEVTDVANAVYDGTDCVMLSGETAAGKYPVDAVRTMSEICVETEKYLMERVEYHSRQGLRNVNSSIGHAAVTVAGRVGATCIVAPTQSGRTARIVANYRTKLPIYAISPSKKTIRRCCFYWGVTGLLGVAQSKLGDLVVSSLELVKAHGLVQKGDLAVLTAGDPATSPSAGAYITSTNVLLAAQIR